MSTKPAVKPPKAKIMTPLHSQIFHLLLPVCLAATAKARPPKKKETGKDEELARRVEAFVKYHNTQRDKISQDYLRFTAKSFSIMFGGIPELDNLSGAGNTFNPFVVVESVKGDIPLMIVTHSRNTTFYAMRQQDAAFIEYNSSLFKPADDEGVEKCLSDLNVKQLKAIMREDLFLPIIQPLFEAQTELVEEEVEE